MRISRTICVKPLVAPLCQSVWRLRLQYTASPTRSLTKRALTPSNPALASAMVSPDHQAKCAEKLARIRQQRGDLIGCLADLFTDVIARRRTFSAYFQFKMYNDPALNPQLYRHAPKSGGA